MKKIPSSVYHLLLSKNFPLKKASQLIPYLYELGIEGICCSPLFESYNHGYDVTNPNLFNPELGTEKDLKEFFNQLKRYGLKHILDVVPNHMGIKGDKNVWWMDVLENGPTSAYADFFDINWNPENKEHKDKIILPILGEPLENLLKVKKIQLIWKKGFWIQYYDYILPVSATAYASILENEKHFAYNKNQLIISCGKSHSAQRRITNILSRINKNPSLLLTVLKKQFYVLENWLSLERNYRRFFNINDLIAIHIENNKVFNAHHRFVFDLIRQGHIQGLRIDHPDGLYDPTQYLKRIRKKKPGILWVEKILVKGECLPEKWPVEGSVGYDFLNVLSGVFIDQKSKEKLTKIYEHFIKNKPVYEKIYYERRKKYILVQMATEINGLGDLLSKELQSFTREDLKVACLEIIACFPVYRTYIKPGYEVRKKDREYVKIAVKKAKTKAPKIDALLFKQIQKLLLSPIKKKWQLRFVSLFQQMTAPIMAKGIEDSAYFIYNRLISLNEVGNSSNDFGSTKEEFHQFNLKKLKLWPLGLLTSSTHDSKYSQDARLRLHALTEIPEKWKSLVFTWRKENKKLFIRLKGKHIPDPNTEYFIYQMLMILGPTDPERAWDCLKKAIREADCFTSWRAVDETYENAVKEFLFALLKNPNPKYILFQKQIAEIGYWNSLSALTLKIGSCGIFDAYQGDELMNISLMDPDNRRPIDFEKRKEELLHQKDLKMKVTTKGFRFRRDHKELFLKGDYIPLKTSHSVIAFARKWKDEEIIIIASRFFTEKRKKEAIKLPPNFSGVIFQDLFTDKEIIVNKRKISMTEIFDPYPFTILIRRKP